ncbi:MAG TPA: Rne/Rng family ribonuclease, partial [Chondromyces sp.]|nr:Rne/Rng family ribonuclease [Chondromyces sp.]
RRMLINAQRPEEVRIAIVTDGVLDQFEIAATESGLCRGNIYRGIVANVQPSLDAAFVNFGVEKDGLLRADDVVADAYQKKPDGGGKHPRVDRILERNRPILVQVVRDGVGHKGALVTTNISIAGRYLVLMPFDDVRGVSRKAEDEDRQAVKDRVAKLELPEGCGVILRTNALDQPQKTLNRDLSALLRLWKKIRTEAGTGKGPKLLYSDQDLIVQALRDSLDSSISEVLVDDTDAFNKAQSYMRTFMPRSGSRLVHYTDRMPLFSRYELEEQIDRIYQRQIGLPSGGSIVIDGTEALTAIDVNSGRATRGANQEETAYKTNLEAAREVARQLRLRDIGGLMVVDFIDMRSSKHQRAVEKAMRDAMKDDKARSSVGRLSDNGLLEINRQRLKKALQLRTYRPCPTCSGTGSIASPELVALNILRRIETRAVTGQLGGVRVELHPELADAIQNDRRQELAALEREFDIEVEIIAAAGLHRAEERIDWRPRAKTEPRPTVPAVSAADIGEAFGQRTQAQDSHEPEDSDEKPAAKEPDAVNDTAPDKPKPRRRRRGGRKRKKSGGGDDTPAANGGEPQPSKQAAAPANEDHEAAAAPGNGDDEAAPPVKKKRRRPRRSRKKSAQTGEPTPSNESSDASPPDAIQPQNDEPDPFSY